MASKRADDGELVAQVRAALTEMRGELDEEQATTLDEVALHDGEVWRLDHSRYDHSDKVVLSGCVLVS